MREFKCPIISNGRVVFAIPRGGVAVAAGVARRLGAPLDVIVVRKIGHPEAPEFGLGAIAERRRTGTSTTRCSAEVGLSVADLAAVVAARAGGAGPAGRRLRAAEPAGCGADGAGGRPRDPMAAGGWRSWWTTGWRPG